MAVLKLRIFSSMIAWKMSIGLCIKIYRHVEKPGRRILKNCLKTEMHRLVAMHLRVG